MHTLPAKKLSSNSTNTKEACCCIFIGYFSVVFVLFDPSSPNNTNQISIIAVKVHTSPLNAQRLAAAAAPVCGGQYRLLKHDARIVTIFSPKRKANIIFYLQVIQQIFAKKCSSNCLHSTCLADCRMSSAMRNKNRLPSRFALAA
ncbi:hypothetical protein [Stenoxybacter acetivorans]|uniref:hypothetical protein n=1 Tax=Stenoxybacter acetivorans TaxID=422441 RepID=UPI001B8049BA|nr:hypothetical protein [Stenoxybacter acetivorans]